MPEPETAATVEIVDTGADENRHTIKNGPWALRTGRADPMNTHPILGDDRRSTTSRSLDEVEVAEIYRCADHLGDDEDGISTVDSVGEQRQAAADGEDPERSRDHTLLSTFRGDPLDDETHREAGLGQKPDR
jgi:hypothetical protein